MKPPHNNRECGCTHVYWLAGMSEDLAVLDWGVMFDQICKKRYGADCDILAIMTKTLRKVRLPAGSSILSHESCHAPTEHCDLRRTTPFSV